MSSVHDPRAVRRELRTRWPMQLLLACVALVCVPRASADFTDPLDAPAISSALAEHGLINGLAWAGKRIVAVGQRGHILYSDDQGHSWLQARVPVRSDLTALSFADASHGWAVGHDGVVLATSDGGNSWRKQLDGRGVGPLVADYYAQHRPRDLDDVAYTKLQAAAQRLVDEGPDKPFLDVWFADAQRGFVVGAFNLILETDDGGAHWTPWLDRTDNPSDLHFYAIRHVGAALYISGEQGMLLKLDAGAQRFRALTVPYRGTLFGVAGDDDALTVFGLRGSAFRSTDAGLHWQALRTQSEGGLAAATHDASGHLLLANQTGQLLRVEPEQLLIEPTTQRVPASAILGLPDGAILIGGANGLHRLLLQAPSGNAP